MEEAENLLKKFGLTRYETRAYVTLLKSGIATAEQISNIGNIPLPRVYDTLVELQKKGFVLISKGRPKRFRPVSSKKALKNLIEIRKKDYEKKIKDLKKSVNSISKNLSKIQPLKLEEKEWDTWYTINRKNVMRFIKEQDLNAKKEILIFSGDMSWLPERIQSIKKAIKNGVKVKSLVSDKKNEELVKNLKIAKKLGIDIKQGYKGLLRGSIIDNKIAAIAMKNSLKSSYELIIFNNPVIASTFRENFNFLWKKLK